MRAGTKVFLGTSLGFAAGIGATLLLQYLYGADGFLKSTIDTALKPPITGTKIAFLVAAVLVFGSLPVAILEWTSERRFLRAERDLRAERPADAVTRYEGPEGRGFLFDGPEGRTLLLEGLGGWGEPRRVELPPVDATITSEGQAPLGEVP